MINIAVCDMERQTFNIMAHYFRKFQAEQNTIFMIHTDSSAHQLAAAYENDWDLIIIDLEAEGAHGIEAAKQIREIDFQIPIMFLSTSLQYCLEGYEIQAFHYLLKPLEYIRFSQIMEQFLRRFSFSGDSIYVKNDSGKYKIPLDKLLFIETDKKRRTLLHTKNNTITSYETLKTYETNLVPFFMRPHISYLVNLNYVEAVLEKDIVLADGHQIPLSRIRRKEFTDAWLRVLPQYE